MKQSPQIILKLGDSVSIWDKLTLNSEPEVDINPKFWQNIPIVYQSDRFWVVDKPYGVPTQLGNNIKVSMVEIMSSWTGKKVYIVHRLDRKTTGLFLIALDSYAARELSNSIQTGVWHKVYHAKLEGDLGMQEGQIDDPIDGKPALTKYKTLEATSDGTLVEFIPITGRKHQLRKHATKFLSPLIGDDIYGNKSKSKMYLRCVSLSFEFWGKLFEFRV